MPVPENPVITDGQRRWLDTIWEAFGDPFSPMHWGVGHLGCARMCVGKLVFVVDRETNHCSVELAMGGTLPGADIKEQMIWRDEHGLDGSYEATRDSMLGGF